MHTFELDSNVASTILNIRDKQGEQEADAAIGRLAALPDITRKAQGDGEAEKK
jgi:hypothetical protein